MTRFLEAILPSWFWPYYTHSQMIKALQKLMPKIDAPSGVRLREPVSLGCPVILPVSDPETHARSPLGTWKKP